MFTLHQAQSTEGLARRNLDSNFATTDGKKTIRIDFGFERGPHLLNLGQIDSFEKVERRSTGIVSTTFNRNARRKNSHHQRWQNSLGN